MTEREHLVLLELLAVCSTVFEENPFQSPKGAQMALRRIQKVTLKAVGVFSSHPTIGRG